MYTTAPTYMTHIQSSGDSSISAFPVGDNLVQWRGTIQSPAGTVYRRVISPVAPVSSSLLILSLAPREPQVYEGLTYKLLLNFPNDYPFTAPHVKFETPCYHPNVSEGDGEICLDILKVRGLNTVPGPTDAAVKPIKYISSRGKGSQSKTIGRVFCSDKLKQICKKKHCICYI